MVTLTFKPGTPKSLGTSATKDGCVDQVRVGQGILELLIGNKKVTDLRTDQLYFEGGHNKTLLK